MFAPLSLLLLLVGAGFGLILGARQMMDVATADGSFVELRRHATRSGRWSTAGVVLGLVAALLISRWDTLGRGLLLGAPLFGLVVLVAVCLGETTGQVPRASHRQASLVTRRVRNYLPVGLTAAVVIATLTLTVSMIGATIAGSADDLGRAGRSLTVACSDIRSGSRGPWPGWFYAGPLLALTGVGIATAAIALIDIVRRTRLGDADTDTDPGRVDDVGAAPTAVDDELRRRSAQTVMAASGVAVAIPLTGVATFGVIALAGTDCLPIAGRVAQYGWVAVIPLATILLGWSAMTLAVNSVSVVAWRKPVR